MSTDAGTAPANSTLQHFTLDDLAPYTAEHAFGPTACGSRRRARLRRGQAARGVHRVDHPLPAGELLLAVEVGKFGSLSEARRARQSPPR